MNKAPRYTKRTLSALTAALILCFALAAPAKADTYIGNAMTTSHGLQEMLGVNEGKNLYAGKNSGFSLSTGFYSGRASGADASASNYMQDTMAGTIGLDRTAELEGDQRMYAMLIDGRYDFNYDLGSGLRPYVSGGMGMAMYGYTTSPALAGQTGDMVPLFRVGGGVAYRMGKQWDLSLDYKEGVSGLGVGNQQIFTSRSQDTVDVHVFNVGMHYAF